jgi:predicted 3-demethylubiquinone-9 3-methyltransferase (glyoxalase superfamily)
MSQVTPFLWFVDGAKDAAEYYVSLFDDSRVLWVQDFPQNGPMEPSVYTLAFQLQGREYYAINGGPAFKPTMAYSMFAEVETQEEIDRLWDALLRDGGEPSQCGWLTDRWGLAWQVCPKQMWEFYASGDRAAVNRTVQAMLTMSKLDLAALQAAFDGTAS